MTEDDPNATHLANEFRHHSLGVCFQCCFTFSSDRHFLHLLPLLLNLRVLYVSELAGKGQLKQLQLLRVLLLYKIFYIVMAKIVLVNQAVELSRIALHLLKIFKFISFSLYANSFVAMIVLSYAISEAIWVDSPCHLHVQFEVEQMSFVSLEYQQECHCQTQMPLVRLLAQTSGVFVVSVRSA